MRNSPGKLMAMCLIGLAASAPMIAAAAERGGPDASSEPPPAIALDKPVPLQPTGNKFCTAQAPAGWKMVAEYRDANITLASPDDRMAASYDLIPVDSGRARGIDGPNFKSPLTVAQFIASEVAETDLDLKGKPEDLNGAQLVEVLSNKGPPRNQSLGRRLGVRGFEIFRTFPLPDDPGGYLFSARIAVGQTAQEAAIAGAVAASINCNTALKPSRDAYGQAHLGGAPLGTTTNCKAGSCDDGDIVGAYSTQLGVGFLHAASGATYLIEVNAGPSAGADGSGFYIQIGSKLEKLTPGLN